MTRRNSQGLNGTWMFLMDAADRYLHIPPTSEEYGNQIQIPGSWEEQGYGSEPAGSPMDTWSKVREYEGAAWYAREFILEDPAETHDQDLKWRHRLVIAGVRWTTVLWVNGIRIGEADSLSVAHEYDITEAIQTGVNTIAIRVDNRMRHPLAESHIHTRHTATAWGGITGEVRIDSLPMTGIDKIQWFPHPEEHLFRCRVSLAGRNLLSRNELSLDVEIHDNAGFVISSLTTEIALNQDEVLLEIKLGTDAVKWSDENPSLYEAAFILRLEGEMLDLHTERIGLRSFRTQGKQLLLNGQPVFLRGYVDCCVFPLTGYPVWDKTHYARQFRIAKEYGFNHVRLHSWHAPEPFWEAADEAGMLVQTELPHWTMNEYAPRSASPDPNVHAFLRQELQRIIARLNRHPSFVLLSMGNELIDDHGHEALNDLVRLARSLDPTRLYTDNTGFGQLPEGDREGDYYIQSFNWHVPLKTEEIAMPATNRNMSAVARLTDKPVIGHEHAQFSMYVRPAERTKYTGVLQPSWLTTIEETLTAKGMTERIPAFVEASGAHLARSLREALERVRRTPGAAGIQLLDIRDFPGQGHATTGILDMFWDSKSIVTPESFRETNDGTVVLMECESRTWYEGETLEARMIVSHYGTEASLSGWIRWRLMENETVYIDGFMELKPLLRGSVGSVGTVLVALPEDGRARTWTLQVELVTSGTRATNEWRFWSFPRPACLTPSSPAEGRIWSSSPAVKSAIYDAIIERNAAFHPMGHPQHRNVQLVVTECLTTNLLQYLVDGGFLWLLATENELYDKVITKYLPVFWNYLMFSGQAGGTMGILSKDHPALDGFPHDGHSDWQWHDLVNGMPAVCLDTIPHVKPIVEAIDNFNRAKRLAYAFEAHVGKGKLFVSTFAFTRPEHLKRPESSYLFGQITDYMRSSRFQPQSRMTVGDVLGLFQLRGIHTFL